MNPIISIVFSRLWGCVPLKLWYLSNSTQDIQAVRGIIQASSEAPKTTYKLKIQYYNSEEYDMNLKISNYV